MQANVEGEKAFQTHMYIEADGVTNGPMMALMMFGTGMPQEGELELLQKGGFMVGKGKTLDTTSTDGELRDTLPSINSLNQPNRMADLYKTAAQALERFLATSAMTKLRPRTKEEKQFASLRATMQNLLGSKNFTLVPNDNNGLDLTIDRGILKNPLTVTLYGSGEKGIASKIASAMLDAYYETHSQFLADPLDPINQENWANIQEDLEPLLKQLYIVPRDTNKAPFVTQVKNYKPTEKSDRFEDYSLSPQQVESLTTNIQQMFVKPMAAAIGTVMGTTYSATTNLRKAIQVQSIYFQVAFDQAVQEALEAKRKGDDNALSLIHI